MSKHLDEYQGTAKPLHVFSDSRWIDPDEELPAIDEVVIGHETNTAYRQMVVDSEGQWWWLAMSGWLKRPKPWRYMYMNYGAPRG